MHTPSTSGNGGPVGLGLTALSNLLQRVEKPRGRAAEYAVVAALRALHTRQPLHPGDEARRDLLVAQVQRLSEEDVAHVVRWVLDPRGGALPGFGRRRARRQLLMLVLLAKTVGVNARFSILPLLNRIGAFGSPERLEFLLGGISRWAFTASSVGLAQELFDLAAQALANAEELFVRDPGSVSYGEFGRWSWQRGLVHLLAWRSAFERRAKAHDADSSINPVLMADRFEFGLARARGFRRIRRRGGRVARATIRSLGYSDRPIRLDRACRRLLTTAALLLVAALGGLAVAHGRAAAFDRAGRSLANSCERRLAARVSPELAVEPAQSGANRSRR